MAAFTPGTGATLQPTTLEHALFTYIRYGQIAENNTTYNPSGANHITSSIKEDTEKFGALSNQYALFEATVSFPCISIPGNELFVPAYFNNGFSSGTGGTYGDSIAYPQMVFNLIRDIQNKERNATSNPNNVKGIPSWSINSNSSTPGGELTNATAKATIKLPIEISVNEADGTIVQLAKEYLL